jgi:HK97 family phage major capsid protein
VYQDPMRGFRSNADFALAVRNACVPGGSIDQRLDVVRREQLANAMPNAVTVGAVTYLNEGNAADSGWAVPPQMREGIWEIAYGGNDIVNMVGWEPVSSNAVEYMADESTPWGSTGVRAYWRTEAGAMTKSKPEAPEPRVIRVNELYAFVQATDELLEDAPRLESRLIQKAGRALNWTASEALINGNGVGKPLGWMQSPALITVAKEVGQAASTVVLNNITKMLIRAIRQGGRLVWLGNQDILPALVPMAIGNYPIFMPVGSKVQDALMDGSLLGVPLQWNDHCKTLGTVGDLQLLNLDGYYALRRTDVKYASSIHLNFDTAQTAFRWTFRFGGTPYLSAPISPANGSSTRSHFIALADRA